MLFLFTNDKGDALEQVPSVPYSRWVEIHLNGAPSKTSCCRHEQGMTLPNAVEMMLSNIQNKPETMTFTVCPCRDNILVLRQVA